MNSQMQMSFGERHARRACAGLAALTVVLGVNAFGPSPSRFVLYSLVFVLLCLHGIRKRQMLEEQRRNEVMEDERDRIIQLRADSRARIALVVGVVSIAVALGIPPLRQVLSSGELRLPALLVFLVIVSSLFSHASEIAAYRKERR